MKKSLPFILFIACGFSFAVQAQQNPASGTVDRKLWLTYLDKLARPVLSNMAEDRLKEKMPVKLSPKIDNPEQRAQVAYLEAFGRLLSGIGPWLNSEGGTAEEIDLRNQYRRWSVKALSNAVNPSAKDYLKWNGGQPLVDASFLALGLIRCPWLWQHSDDITRENIEKAFTITRATVPVYSNWILFSSMIEAFFCQYGLDYDPVRIEFGVREFANHWYVGDGLFSDGMDYHWDYYNSYVIQPYLATVVDIVHKKKNAYSWFVPRLDKITKRYAEIQERLINTDGTFPVTGRSIAYRGGAFHHLADMAMRQQLPESLSPAQVRSALTAVIKKTSESPDTFTKEGWLNIGLYGHQPNIADFYINTGSLYLCANILLPLGLPADNPFWSSPAEPWTAVKVWSGKDLPADHALDLR